MKNWKCNTCDGYIRVDLSKIMEGDKVFFVKNNNIFDNDIVFEKGTVVGKENSFYNIISEKKYNKRVYKVDSKLIYPFHAPAPIVYNMFWVCKCC